MKKYTSVIVFIIFGTLLWQYANHPRAITQEIHHAIQSKVAELITNDVRKRYPDASQFQIEKLVSSEMNDNKVKVSFSFSYTDPTTQSQINQQGEAVFHREKSDEIGKTLWKMQSKSLTQNEVIFTEDEIVTPEHSASNDANTNGSEAANTDKSEASTQAPDKAPPQESPDKKESH